MMNLLALRKIRLLLKIIKYKIVQKIAHQLRFSRKKLNAAIYKFLNILQQNNKFAKSCHCQSQKTCKRPFIRKFKMIIIQKYKMKNYLHVQVLKHFRN